MHLKDTRLGDTVIVYLGVDGDLRKQKCGRANGEWPLQATIVGTCYHSMTGVSHVMLGFANTVSMVPNKIVRDVAPHNTPGYAFLKDFHKQYRWTIWEESDMECDPLVCAGIKTTASTIKRYAGNVCPCGIHIDMHPCDYHPYQP